MKERVKPGNEAAAAAAGSLLNFARTPGIHIPQDGYVPVLSCEQLEKQAVWTWQVPRNETGSNHFFGNRDAIYNLLLQCQFQLAIVL